MVSFIEKRQLRDFDWLTAFLAVVIVVFGVWQIYNAQPHLSYWSKQIIGLVIALIAMVVVAATDYRRLIDAAPIIYGIGIILLVLVLIPGLGVKVNGQTAWLKIPLLGRFQPSEFVKIPVVLMLASYFGKRRLGTLRFKELCVGIGILVLPLGLIMLEPDAGQAITYFPLLAVVLFLSAVKMRYVFFNSPCFSGICSGVLHYWSSNGFNKKLPTSADRSYFRPRKCRPTWLWLPHFSIHNYCWKGAGYRDQRGSQYFSEPIKIFACASNGFYLCRCCRKHGICWMYFALAGLRAAFIQTYRWGSAIAGSGRNACDNGDRWGNDISDICKCWNGFRVFAGYRCASAIDECGAFSSVINIYCNWICNKC